MQRKPRLFDLFDLLPRSVDSQPPSQPHVFPGLKFRLWFNIVWSFAWICWGSSHVCDMKVTLSDDISLTRSFCHLTGDTSLTIGSAPSLGATFNDNQTGAVQREQAQCQGHVMFKRNSDSVSHTSKKSRERADKSQDMDTREGMGWAEKRWVRVEWSRAEWRRVEWRREEWKRGLLNRDE